METTTIEIVEIDQHFHVEELEDRFEMAIAAPNVVCWITDL